MPSAPEDEALAVYRKNPTSEHLSGLLRAYQGRAYNLCYQVLRHREDAEDAAQDVLIKIIGLLPHVHSSLSLQRWLYRICLNQALDLRRKRGRRQNRELRYSMKPEPAATEPGNDQDEARLLLFQALERIEDEQRRLIVEHYFEKTPLERMAIREGASKSAIWKMIERARQSLRGSLVSLGMPAVVPVSFSFLESCQPVALPCDLVSGAVAKAVATSTLNAAAMGGTVVAAKGTFAGLAVFIATIALCVGGAAGYLVRPAEAAAGKVKELEQRLATVSRDFPNARMNGDRQSPRAAHDAESARIFELEAQVRTLQDSNEKSLRTIQALQSQTNTKYAGHPSVAPYSGGFEYNLSQVADLLNLDAGRSASLKHIHEEIQEKIRQVETELATVESKDDNITRIVVPPFGDRAKTLKDEWNAKLATVLTSSEIEKYTKHKLGAHIFSDGFGEGGKTLVLRREGDKGRIIVEIGAHGNESGHSIEWAPEAYEECAARFERYYGYLLK